MPRLGLISLIAAAALGACAGSEAQTADERRRHAMVARIE